jgi:hypothetical protein
MPPKALLGHILNELFAKVKKIIPEKIPHLAFLPNNYYFCLKIANILTKTLSQKVFAILQHFLLVWAHYSHAAIFGSLNSRDLRSN